MTHPIATLEREAKRYVSAGTDLDAARKRLHRAVRAAAKAGVPKAEIARVAGLSRQTVYDLLRGGTS